MEKFNFCIGATAYFLVFDSVPQMAANPLFQQIVCCGCGSQSRNFTIDLLSCLYGRESFYGLSGATARIHKVKARSTSSQ